MSTGGHSQKLERRGPWTPLPSILGSLGLLAGFHIQPSRLLTVSVLTCRAGKLCQRTQYKHTGSTGKLPAKCDKGALNTAKAYGSRHEIIPCLGLRTMQAFSIELKVLGGYKLHFTPAVKKLARLSLSGRTLLMWNNIFYLPSHSSILFWPLSGNLLSGFTGKMCE